MESNFWVSAGTAIIMGTLMALYYMAMFVVVGVIGFTLAAIIDAMFKTNLVSKLKVFFNERKEASLQRVKAMKEENNQNNQQKAKTGKNAKAKTGKTSTRKATPTSPGVAVAA